MLGFLVMICIIIGLFRLTAFFFHVIGRLLGGIFSVAGWLILAGLAVWVFGFAFFVFPIILIIGAVAIAVALAA